MKTAAVNVKKNEKENVENKIFNKMTAVEEEFVKVEEQAKEEVKEEEKEVRKRDKVQEIISLPHAPIRDKFVNELYTQTVSDVITKDDKLHSLHDIILNSMKTLHKAITKAENNQTDKKTDNVALEGMWEVWDLLEQGLNSIHEYRKNELVTAMQWSTELKAELTKTSNSKPFMLFGPEMAETFLIYKFRQCNLELTQRKVKHENLVAYCNSHGNLYHRISHLL